MNNSTEGQRVAAMVGITETDCIAFKGEKEREILQPSWCLDPGDSMLDN